jgi:protein TonB
MEVPMQNPVPHPLLAARRSDARILKVCFLCALTAQVLVLLIPWKKEPLLPEPPPVVESVPIVPYDFQPPELSVRTVVEVEPHERRMLIPSEDPDNDMLEPVDDVSVPDIPPAFDDDAGEPLYLENTEPRDSRIHDSWERDLVLPVRLEGAADPDYPELGVLSRTAGVVLLQAVVDESGRVVELEVIRAPRPDPGFSQAALDAVAAWRYRPGTVNGRPVAVRMSVRVEFSLR